LNFTSKSPMIIIMKVKVVMRTVMALLAVAMWLGDQARSQESLSPPLDSYGEQVWVEPEAEEIVALEAVISTVKGYNGAPLEPDHRLTLMARELAREIQKDPRLQSKVLASPLTRELKNHFGIYDDSMLLRSFSFIEPGEILERMSNLCPSEQTDFTHVGIGVAPAAPAIRPGALVVIMTARLTEILPFPRQVQTPSTWTLEGRLINQAQNAKPRVLLTFPAGQVAHVPVSGTAAGFSAVIPFSEGDGNYRLEVVAKSNGDSRLAALLVVAAGHYGEDTGTFTVTGFEEEPADEAQAEQMIFDMINQVRLKEGLLPLAHDYRLQALAKVHSEDMRRFSYVGHSSPVNGALEDRKEAAGLGSYLVRENLAKNASLTQAMNSLLQSPAHRAAIIDPRVTSVGVGVSFDSKTGTRHYYVVQEFGKMY
jgi:uncharacterized protein YkwD